MPTRSLHPSIRLARNVALVTGLLLLIPLVATQFTEEVVWSPSDFVVAGALLFGTAFSYALVAAKLGSATRRLAVAVALGAALLLVWLNLAVGLIGDERNPANSMYLGVLAVGVIGATVARLKPNAMAIALSATAAAQVLVAAIAVAISLGSGGREIAAIVILNGLFVALFLGSAWLFRRAAHAR